jgi:hypothetical protein
MPTPRPFEQIAAEQGWTTATQLQVLMNYIQLNSLERALGRYAATVQAFERFQAFENILEAGEEELASGKPVPTLDEVIEP